MNVLRGLPYYEHPLALSKRAEVTDHGRRRPVLILHRAQFIGLRLVLEGASCAS